MTKLQAERLTKFVRDHGNPARVYQGPMSTGESAGYAVKAAGTYVHAFTGKRMRELTTMFYPAEVLTWLGY